MGVRLCMYEREKESRIITWDPYGAKQTILHVYTQTLRIAVATHNR